MTINGHGCIGHDDWLSLVHVPTACTTHISANVAFPSSGTETSLTETAIKEEESLIVNGVKTEDIALCSSRSRQHRNSYGPRSRRSSSSDDLSPQHRKREEVKQSTGRPPPVTRKNRDSLEGSKITIDVDSLMRFMSGDLESEDENLVEEEEEEVEFLKMKPILRAEEQQRSDIKPIKNRTPAKPPPAPRAHKKMEPEKTETKSSELDARKCNGELEDSEEDFKLQTRMRGRSNAIDMKTSPSLRSKAQKAKTDSNSFEGVKEKENEPETPSAKPLEPSKDAKKKDLRRSTSIQAEDGGVRRSGSWSRRKHLSGDKALGIFYHSRRSQLMDPEALEEAERRLKERSASLERSDTSAPHSPTTPSIRPRDSRGLSPHPKSPLVTRGSGIFEHGMAEQEKRVEAVQTTNASDPAGTTVAEAEDHLEEMSAFQKQLMLKRTNRVGLKQKKILAMMEEETLIDDPSSKAVKLLKHRKLEVCVWEV